MFRFVSKQIYSPYFFTTNNMKHNLFYWCLQNIFELHKNLAGKIKNYLKLHYEENRRIIW